MWTVRPRYQTRRTTDRSPPGIWWYSAQRSQGTAPTVLSFFALKIELDNRLWFLRTSRLEKERDSCLIAGKGVSNFPKETENKNRAKKVKNNDVPLQWPGRKPAILLEKLLLLWCCRESLILSKDSKEMMLGNVFITF